VRAGSTKKSNAWTVRRFVTLDRNRGPGL
jgi:hypothetical protein